MMVILLVNVLMVLHSGVQASETPATPMDLPHATERDLHNITFFNGVFGDVEGVALFFDCLGSHFTWLQSIFTSFPALLNFVGKMKCVTGICPRDFEDYGCACRFEMEGLPADEADSCCFQHRKCYEEATEEDCVWDPAKITMDVSCLTKNLTCESEDPCERLLCNCDKAAIECFVHSRINSSLNSLDVSFCPSLVTETASEKSQTTIHEAEFQHQRIGNTQLTTPSMSEVISQPTRAIVDGTPGVEHVERDGGLEALGGGDVPQESGDLLLRYLEERAQESITAVLGDSMPKEAQGDLTAAFEDFTPRGMTENAVFIEETTSAPSGTNSTEPESIPTSDLPGRSTGDGHHFKVAGEEEGTTFPTLAPEETPDLEESFGEVCGRFTFLQLRENGKVKRELPQLGEMLYCLTDRCPEEFELYGCYCGQEGRGHPTDDLDRCCFSHNCCLEQVKKLGCHPERSSRSEVVCFDHAPKCVGWTMCEKLQCSCDKAAAECMAGAVFNESLRFPHRQACQEESLFCRRGVHDWPLGSAGTGFGGSSEEESSSEEAVAARRRGRRATRRAWGNSRVAPSQIR